MAAPAYPWIDSWAPFQFTTQPQVGSIQSPEASAVNQATTQNYDATIPHKIAGTIVLALIVVFTLRQLGFRFVVTAGVGR